MAYPPGRLLNPRKLSAFGPALASCVVLLAAAAPDARTPAIALSVRQTTYDPLDAVDITLFVRNGDAKPYVAHFAQTGEYTIWLGTDAPDERELWRAPAGAGAAHARTFLPGTTTLVTYEWNGVLADGSAPAAGDYALRAALPLAGSATAAAAMRLRIVAPLPVSGLALTGTRVVTISGTLDAAGATLTDASGSVALARRIRNAPAGATIDVRGAMAQQPDGTRAFFIERWAPVERPVARTTPNPGTSNG